MSTAPPQESPPIDIPLPTPPGLRRYRSASASSTAIAGDAASLDRAAIDETVVDLLLWHGWRFERANPWSPDVYLRPPPEHPRAAAEVSRSHSVETTWRKRPIRVPTWAVES